MAMVNNTSVSRGMHDLFKLVILFSLEKYPRVKLLNHMVCVCVWAQSCPTLCDPPGWSSPGSPVNGFSWQEYWSGLPFPIPGDLPDPESNLRSCISCIGRWILYHRSHLGSLGSSDSSSKTFWGNSMLFPHRDCTILPPQQQYRSVSFFYLLTNTCYLLSFYNSYSDSCEVIPHCGFDLHFLDD